MIKDLTLSEILAAARADGSVPQTFWTEGEIAAQLNARYKAVTYKRIVRVRQWLLSNGHGVSNAELEALCIWQQVQDKSIKTAVLGFKYLLLKEEEKNGGKWTLEADKIAEGLARHIVRAHKEE